MLLVEFLLNVAKQLKLNHEHTIVTFSYFTNWITTHQGLQKNKYGSVAIVCSYVDLTILTLTRVNFSGTKMCLSPIIKWENHILKDSWNILYIISYQNTPFGTKRLSVLHNIAQKY